MQKLLIYVGALACEGKFYSGKLGCVAARERVVSGLLKWGRAP